VKIVKFFGVKQAKNYHEKQRKHGDFAKKEAKINSEYFVMKTLTNNENIAQ